MMLSDLCVEQKISSAGRKHARNMYNVYMYLESTRTTCQESIQYWLATSSRDIHESYLYMYVLYKCIRG